MRKIINSITSPAAIERMGQLIKFHVTSFIDNIIETGEADLTSVIGVPAIITVDWLGLPVEHWETYAFAFHALLVEVPGSEGWDKAVTVDMPHLEEVTRKIIAQRRIEPKDDLIATWSANRSMARA